MSFSLRASSSSCFEILGDQLGLLQDRGQGGGGAGPDRVHPLGPGEEAQGDHQRGQRVGQGAGQAERGNRAGLELVQVTRGVFDLQLVQGRGLRPIEEFERGGGAVLEPAACIGGRGGRMPGELASQRDQGPERRAGQKDRPGLRR